MAKSKVDHRGCVFVRHRTVLCTNMFEQSRFQDPDLCFSLRLQSYIYFLQNLAVN